MQTTASSHGNLCSFGYNRGKANLSLTACLANWSHWQLSCCVLWKGHIVPWDVVIHVGLDMLEGECSGYPLPNITERTKNITAGPARLDSTTHLISPINRDLIVAEYCHA